MPVSFVVVLVLIVDATCTAARPAELPVVVLVVAGAVAANADAGIGERVGLGRLDIRPLGRCARLIGTCLLSAAPISAVVAGRAAACWHRATAV